MNVNKYSSLTTFALIKLLKLVKNVFVNLKISIMIWILSKGFFLEKASKEQEMWSLQFEREAR